MTWNTTRRWAVAGMGATLVATVTACGGNLDAGGGGDDAAASFPDGPITLLIGQDPGGSTDLIGRALADIASDELGVAISVQNRPGANGALAAEALAESEPDGQTLMVFNGSLAYITPLAVSADEAQDINDFTVVTGISQDDYVLVTAADSGIASLDDVAAAGSVTYGTTGVGTGSQLSTALLTGELGVQATAVPFDGGAPTLTAVLGGQVDIASIQLGEAASQIEAGELTPLVTFAAERNEFLPDVPTAVEEGYADAEVQQSRAIVAPDGTPDDVVQALQDAFDTAFADPGYQEFNAERLLTANEVDGEELQTVWSDNLENYRSLTEQYGIDLGGGA